MSKYRCFLREIIEFSKTFFPFIFFWKLKHSVRYNYSLQIRLVILFGYERKVGDKTLAAKIPVLLILGDKTFGLKIDPERTVGDNISGLSTYGLNISGDKTYGFTTFGAKT